MTGYALHPEAEDDLSAIWDYVAEDSFDTADRLLDEIELAFERLVVFPNSGHRRPDLTSRPLRFANVRSYLIAYAPDRTPLWVIAIMHGRRSPRVMAAVLRGRE